MAAAAVAVRKFVDRRGKSRPAAAAGLALAAVIAALAGTAWGVHLDHRVVDQVPERPQAIDLERAGYRGVQIGTPSSGLPRVLDSSGRPHDGGTVSEQEGESGPSSHPSWEVRLFPRLAVFVDKGRVRGVATADEAAQTREGVGVGDSLEVAKRRYEGLECYGVTLGSDATNPSYPACDGRLKGGCEIYFGGDPVDTVWVTEKSALQTGSGPISRVR